MTVGNKVTAYKYSKNDELLLTDTLNTDTEYDSFGNEVKPDSKDENPFR